MAPWVRLLEAYAVQALLRTPAFHRFVEKVAKGVHRVRHGTPPEELGGTDIDKPGVSSFAQHFVDEVKQQLGGMETKQTGGVNINSNAMDHQAGKSKLHDQPSTEDHSADAVWKASRSKMQNHVESADGARTENESADAVWRETQKQSTQPAKEGFMAEYMDALRDQLRQKQPPR